MKNMRRTLFRVCWIIGFMVFLGLAFFSDGGVLSGLNLALAVLWFIYGGPAIFTWIYSAQASRAFRKGEYDKFLMILREGCPWYLRGTLDEIKFCFDLAKRGNADFLNLSNQICDLYDEWHEYNGELKICFSKFKAWYSREQAQNGDTEAAYKLGGYLRDGYGVEQDFGEASQWFLKAAEAGDPNAGYQLALLYRDGKGVPQNYVESVKWLKKASDSGVIAASFELGQRYLKEEGIKRDYAECARLYKKTAEAGDVDSKFILGLLYIDGAGVEQDYVKASGLISEAYFSSDELKVFSKGDVDLILAEMFEQGQGVLRNLSKAFDYRLEAAELGYIEAQFLVGKMYLNGRGVKQNSKKGIKWLCEAAENESLEALNYLGEVYQKGIGVLTDYVEAARFYLKAANQGCADAQYHIAYMYENGLGVERDKWRANEWYQKAAKSGHELAKIELRRFGGSDGDELIVPCNKCDKSDECEFLRPNRRDGLDSFSNKVDLTGYAWRRFMARMVDLALGALVIYGLLYLGVTKVWGGDIDSMNEFLFGTVLRCVITSLASLLIIVTGDVIPYVFGNSFGKAIMRLKVSYTNGESLSIWAYCSRNFRAFFYGLGMTIFPIDIIASVIQFVKVSKTGYTSYDRKGEECGPIPRPISAEISCVNYLIAIAIIAAIILTISMIDIPYKEVI